MIQLENVWFEYKPGNLIFSGINLRIPSPSWTVVCGPDGSGKTTLGKMVSGLLKPQTGVVKLEEFEQNDRTMIGYIGGDCSTCIVGVTVEDDICFGMENIRLSRSEMQRRLKKVTQAVGLEGFEKRLTSTLSGGERQKLALAGVLAMEAEILILDDAFSMIDWSARHMLRSLVQRLKNELKLTVVEMTNQSAEILRGEIIVLLGPSGTLEFVGSRANFLNLEIARKWIIHQGGLNALLASFPGKMIDQVERIYKELNVL